MPAHPLIQAAETLREALRPLTFAPPVDCVYQPLDYAWAPHTAYLSRFGSGRKKVVFVGMNPGPFGMTQTGVPFGEIAALRDWMKINEPVGKPPREHPKRPVVGFDCPQCPHAGLSTRSAEAQKLRARRIGCAQPRPKTRGALRARRGTPRVAWTS